MHRNFLIFLFLLSNYSNAIPITINSQSNLDFGLNVQGDPPKTIPASTSENAQNGSFLISGDVGRSYTIVLPLTITLITGAGGSNRTMTVTSFTSFPLITGLLNAAGNQTLFVGATRLSLSTNQAVGTYVGDYTVTVVY